MANPQGMQWATGRFFENAVEGGMEMQESKALGISGVGAAKVCLEKWMWDDELLRTTYETTLQLHQYLLFLKNLLIIFL